MNAVLKALKAKNPKLKTKYVYNHVTQSLEEVVILGAERVD